jgi:regulator of sigma E protease
MSVIEVILAILALGMLIVVHEGGHYLVARWCKMRVEKFSLGFGPPIVKWMSKGEVVLKDGKVVGVRGTQFQIAPIPLGGFVQITGMNPHEEFDANDPTIYPNRPTWQRFVTIFAGPFTNLLFSIVLIFIVFVSAGMNTPRYMVDEVLAPDAKTGQTAAAHGILKPQDRILRIDGQELYFTSATALQDRVQEAKGQPMEIVVLRDGKELTVKVAAQRDASGDYRLGIKLAAYRERHKVGVGTAAVEAFKYPWVKSGEMLSNLYDVIRRKAPADATGPVGIARMIKATIKLGWVEALEFLAFLNVALGLFNLLPVPALDGGRLVFLGYELVTRRRPNPRVEAAVHMVGFVVLMLLFVVITFKDIKGLFS